MKFFPDRFKDEAADWHASYIEEHDNPNYADWKNDFINRFRDEADLDNLKNKLQNLTPKPDQRARAFVAKLNSLYDGVYGKEPSISAGATQEARAMNNTIKRIPGSTTYPNHILETWGISPTWVRHPPPHGFVLGHLNDILT